MKCPTCGAEVVVDFRAQRRFCATCSRSPNFCSCAPVRRPAWLRNLKAKELTREGAAA